MEGASGYVRLPRAICGMRSVLGWLLAGVIVWNGCSIAPPARDDAYAAYAREDYLQALNKFRVLVEREPDNVQAHEYLGRTYTKLGEHEEAVECYERVLELDPQHPRAHARLGLLHSKLGHTQEAIRHYREVVKTNPSLAELLCNRLGTDLMRKDLVPEALKVFRVGVDVAPKSATLWNNLGLAHARLGDTGDAMEAYRTALGLDPRSASIHYNLGVAYQDQEKTDQAVLQYERTLELDPLFIRARRSLALLSGVLGERERALEHILELANNDSATAVEVALDVAADFAGRGDYLTAIRFYSIALEAAPNAPHIYNLLGSAHRNVGNYEAAIAAYQEALRLDSNFLEAHNNLGVVFQDQGQLEEAIGEYRKAISLDSKLIKARSNLASAYERADLYEKALEQYAVIRRLEPDNAEVCVTMGDLRLNLAVNNGRKAQGAYFHAEYDYREALQRRSDCVPAYNGLGEVYFKLQEYQKALEMFRKSIDLDPDQERVREWIEKCSRELGMISLGVRCMYTVGEGEAS